MKPSLVVIDCNRVTGYSITSEQALAVEQTLLSEKAEIHVDPPNSEMPAPSSGESQNEEKADVVLTFAELQELITAGRVDSIPNNKIIPGGLNVRCSLLRIILYLPPSRKGSQACPQLQSERSHGRLLFRNLRPIRAWLRLLFYVVL